VKASGDLLDRERGFFAQAYGEAELISLALAA
jgi:hypothetical protein